jgi:predicted MFS family arabinose efflux permease
MVYLKEFRTHWRPLVAALIGMGCGFSITNYVTSIMAPHLIAEFGWSKAEFALIGSLGLVSVIVFPFVGRLTDRIGVRRTAIIGIITAPIVYFLLSRMTGDIRIYIALFLVQAVLCVTTTATVYSRAVVQYITGARGLALAIVASGPAIVGALGGPILNNFVQAQGWRAGYLALAVFSIVMNAAALLMLPSERRDASPHTRPRKARQDYPEIFRNRAFWFLLAAMLLCNLPQVIALTQLNLVMIDNGVSAGRISGMISAFAIGTLAGRFACGIALDRYPPHLVATIGMALSAVGFLLIASNFDAPLVLMSAILLVGLSFGAEGDLVSFLVVRTFGVRIYSSVMGMMTAAIAISASLGAGMLAYLLSRTGGFSVFLWICGVAVLLGSLLFLVMPRDVAANDSAV